MRRLFTLALLFAFICAISAATQTPQNSQKKTHARKKAQKVQEITTDKLIDALPQQPPPPPPTPEQGPSSPPEVTYQGGQLVILARNSTMSDVLTAVKQKTGASVEMPAVSSERVVGRFGPGAPRDVLAQLLNGSHYDYVLLGSPADPGALRKVVLMARSSGPQPNPQLAQQSPRALQNQNGQEDQNLQAVPEVDTNQPEAEENNDTSQDAQQPPEEPQTDQPGQANGPAVKTPEQLLRELQQQQQQQQQEQQGAPPGAPGQPPQ